MDSEARTPRNSASDAGTKVKPDRAAVLKLPVPKKAAFLAWSLTGLAFAALRKRYIPTGSMQSLGRSANTMLTGRVVQLDWPHLEFRTS